MTRLGALASIVALAACGSATPPTGWQQGGARMVVPNARWLVMGSTIDVRADGRVYVDGEHTFTVDGSGRVFDEDNVPVAIVFADGTVRGPGDSPLGRVGYLNASLADQTYAWITLTPQGPVIRYDEEGERYDFGAWLGCGQAPETLFTCTLVTHLLGRRVMSAAVARADALDPTPMPGFGFGMGVGVGR